MGRPLKKKYFGNTVSGGLGGESVATFVTGTAGSYAGGSQPTFTVDLPTLPAGVRATGTTVMGALSATASVAGNGYNVNDVLTVSYNGGIATFTVATLTGGAGSGVATVTLLSSGTFSATTTGAKATTVLPAGGDNACTLTVTYKIVGGTVVVSGTGYESAPSTTMSAGTGTLTTTLTATTQNAITGSAYVRGGTSANRTSIDIIKQSGSHRYLVKTSDGTGVCTLVNRTPAMGGEMNIVATDDTGGTYYVTKLTDRKAWLRTGVGSTGTQFADGAVVSWNLTAAVQDVSVLIPSK